MSWFFDCDPGGNRTFLIPAYCVKDEEAQRALRIVQSEHNEFEQGGFITRASHPEAAGRLEMSGGEFCGNAARACAAVIARDSFADRRLDGIIERSRIRANTSVGGERVAESSSLSCSFLLEVSGYDRPINVQVRVATTCRTKIEMPPVCFGSSIEGLNISVGGRSVRATSVRLPGISHIIVEDGYPSESWVGSSGLKNAAAIVDAVRSSKNLSGALAIGILHVKEGNPPSLLPYVWVKNTGTFVAETSCGSGSLAVAMRDALGDEACSGNRAGQGDFIIRQPSGHVLRIEWQLRGEMFVSSLEGDVVSIVERDLGVIGGNAYVRSAEYSGR